MSARTDRIAAIEAQPQTNFTRMQLSTYTNMTDAQYDLRVARWKVRRNSQLEARTRTVKRLAAELHAKG
jgi:hypothetical protein